MDDYPPDEMPSPSEQPWPGAGYGPPSNDEPLPRGQAGVAWAVIVVVVATVVFGIALLSRSAGEGENAENQIALLLTEVQGKYVVGGSELFGDKMRAQFRRDIDKLMAGGSISQRQQRVILMAEVGSVQDAARDLRELQELIKLRSVETPDRPALELTENQQRVMEILHALYPDDEDADAPAVDALSGQDRDDLVEKLGWFGELALVPRELADDAARQPVVAPAKRIIIIVLLGAIWFGIVGLTGSITLMIVLAIGAAQRRLEGGLTTPGRAPHGLYAETFAVWIVAFFSLQIAAELIGQHATAHRLFISFVAFMVSLLALGWPVLRGVRWSDARADIGLTAGRFPAAEPFAGLLAYAMAVPLLLIGVVMMLALMAIQTLVQGGPGDPLSPETTPAHPVVLEAARGGWWQAAQLLLVAAVAAPIVEEIMFRGVLYRHLRDATRTIGVTGSIVISTLINAFIFAVIHPQGWVATPVLMAMAIAFTIVREWRGTIVPSIVAHAVWNGIIMSLMILALG